MIFMPALFHGVRILDFTKVLSGPLATRMFADEGAEVLKIESEAHHDDARDFPPLHHGWSGYFEVLNRNKKGVQLDASRPRDLKAIYTLCKDADVVVENMTPSTKHRLKIDDQTLRAINPRLIYASLSGLGQADDRKYYDMIAQAESGLMSLNGFPDAPLKIGPPIVDTFSGMTLAFAIASALFYRERTGEGQSIDVSMLGCSMNLLESNLIEYAVRKQNPERTGNQDNQVSPFGVYKTRDGSIALAIGNNALWNAFAGFLETHRPLERERYVTNQLRLEHAAALTVLIEEIFKGYLTEDLVLRLNLLQIPCSRVNTMADVYHDERHYQTQRLVKYASPQFGECVVPGKSVHFSAVDAVGFSPAPALDQNTEDYVV